MHPFHSISLSLTPPVILFIILSVPLHFQFVSSPPSSLPPTFLVLIRLHVSLIFLLLLHSPLRVSCYHTSPLRSPPLLTGTILHSAPGSGYSVCVCFIVAFSHTRTCRCTHTHSTVPDFRCEWCGVMQHHLARAVH